MLHGPEFGAPLAVHREQHRRNRQARLFLGKFHGLHIAWIEPAHAAVQIPNAGGGEPTCVALGQVGIGPRRIHGQLLQGVLPIGQSHGGPHHEPWSELLHQRGRAGVVGIGIDQEIHRPWQLLAGTEALVDPGAGVFQFPRALAAAIQDLALGMAALERPQQGHQYHQVAQLGGAEHQDARLGAQRLIGKPLHLACPGLSVCSL
jgi:hypothetical protein